MKKILLAALAFATASTAFAGDDNIPMTRSHDGLTGDHVQVKTFNNRNQRVHVPTRYVDLDGKQITICLTEVSTGGKECSPHRGWRTFYPENITIVPGQEYDVSLTFWEGSGNKTTTVRTTAYNADLARGEKLQGRSCRAHANLAIANLQIEKVEIALEKQAARDRAARGHISNAEKKQTIGDLDWELGEVNYEINQKRAAKNGC